MRKTWGENLRRPKRRKCSHPYLFCHLLFQAPVSFTLSRDNKSLWNLRHIFVCRHLSQLNHLKSTFLFAWNEEIRRHRSSPVSPIKRLDKKQVTERFKNEVLCLCFFLSSVYGGAFQLVLRVGTGTQNGLNTDPFHVPVSISWQVRDKPHKLWKMDKSWFW